MKNLKVKDIAHVIAYNKSIQIVDNNGIMNYGTLYSLSYNGKIKALEKYNNYYVVMILPYSKNSISLFISEKKYY